MHDHRNTVNLQKKRERDERGYDKRGRGDRCTTRERRERCTTREREGYNMRSRREESTTRGRGVQQEVGEVLPERGGVLQEGGVGTREESTIEGEQERGVCKERRTRERGT